MEVTLLPARAILRLRGPAALKFLHDVSTQDVAGLHLGEGALAAFLDDKGLVLAEARILATDDGAQLDADQAATPGLQRAVARVAPLAGVEVEDETWEAARVCGGAGPEPEHAWAEREGALWVRVAWGGEGWDLLAPSLGRAIAGLGASEGDPGRLEEERIAAGRPRFGVDVTDQTLVNETPLLEHAVSFSKGCYPGQESVARVRNLGRVRRKLRTLALESGGAAPGDEVRVGEQAVGKVTSAAGVHALAMISSDLEPGARVEVAGSAAAVTDAGWR